MDHALSLIWQSRVNIGVDVSYDQSDQPGTTRRVTPANEKAELDEKYGPRPTK